VFNSYIGNYLLNKKLIDSKTLKEIMDLEAATHLQLGVIAMHEGYLAGTQVEEILRAQKMFDSPFGEIAVAKGYLNKKQLQELLDHQTNGSAKLVQTIIDKGFFTMEEMDRILLDYRNENNLTKEEVIALKRGDVEQFLSPYIKLQCDLADLQDYETLGAYGNLFIRNMIRFIDHQTILDIETAYTALKNPIAIEQRLEGDLSLRTYLVMDEPVYYTFAEKFAQIPVNKDPELAKASVEEFLNLHNGLFSVWMSETEREVTLMPPEKSSDFLDVEKESHVYVSFKTSFGSLFLVIYSGG